ncbi:homoserine kinase [Caldiplasma sukawensis]
MKTVESYCSSANMGAGFDVFALALSAFKDTLRISYKETNESKIILKYEDEIIPPLQNTSGVAIKTLMDEYEIRGTVFIEIKKGIPLSAGLGGSGASAVAAVSGLNDELSLNLNPSEIIRFSSKGEEKFSGIGHLDNVSASLYGDFVIVKNKSPPLIKKIHFPDWIYIHILVISGNISNKTMKARSVIKSEISLENTVSNIANASLFISGIMSDDREAISEGLNDTIVEPIRSNLYPYFPEIKEKSKTFGAIGSAISGAGPSVITLCDEKTRLNEFSSFCKNLMNKWNLKYEEKISAAGGGILDERGNRIFA